MDYFFAAIFFFKRWISETNEADAKALAFFVLIAAIIISFVTMPFVRVGYKGEGTRIPKPPFSYFQMFYGVTAMASGAVGLFAIVYSTLRYVTGPGKSERDVLPFFDFDFSVGVGLIVAAFLGMASTVVVFKRPPRKSD